MTRSARLPRWWWICLVPLVVCLGRDSVAQTPDGGATTGAGSPDRKAAIDDAEPLPPNDLVLYQEARDVQAEMASALEDQASLKRLLQAVQVAKTQWGVQRQTIDTAAAPLRATTCDEKQIPEIKEALTSLDRSMRDANVQIRNEIVSVEIKSKPYLDSALTGALMFASRVNTLGDKVDCAQFKRADVAGNLQKWETAMDQAFKDAEKAVGDELTTAAGRLETLQSKRARLLKAQADAQKKAADQQAVQQNYLWVVVVLGVFSIAMMAIPRFYPTASQIEWVASGQTVQLATAMVLLIVVLMLGLSNLLHENTLGTLLGGIAGYVLSQGVGRLPKPSTSTAHSPSPVSPPSPVHRPTVPVAGAETVPQGAVAQARGKDPQPASETRV